MLVDAACVIIDIPTTNSSTADSQKTRDIANSISATPKTSAERADDAAEAADGGA